MASKHDDTDSLRDVHRCTETVRIGRTAICIRCVAVFACIAFGMAVTSAYATEVQSKENAKIAVNKSDVSCDAPAALKNSYTARHIPHNRDRSCLVSLSAADKLSTKKDFNFVDVRSPSEYSLYRIAGSINIPLHLLKTKEFLKKLSVVLVNNGRTTIELENMCSELKRSGFEHVAVLDGGLLAWYASKRPLEGDPAAQSKLNRMSAQELFKERTMSDWTVINISTPGKYKDMRPWLPANVLAIPLKSKGDSIARIALNIKQQRKRNPHGKILLIADDNKGYARIDARLKKSGIDASVLRLDVGLDGYRVQVEKQLALWKQQNQPRKYEACRG